MRTMTVELDSETIEKAFLKSLRDVKHDMKQQLKFIDKMQNKGTTLPYMGIFDSDMFQDWIEIEEFLKAVRAVEVYYGGE